MWSASIQIGEEGQNELARQVEINNSIAGSSLAQVFLVSEAAACQLTAIWLYDIADSRL